MEESVRVDPRATLVNEIREQNFDLIRFSSYRTACKLRFIQKKCNLHVIDIWNVIEAFRENSLNTLEPNSCVNVSRLETLLSSLYHNLNKRTPPASQVSVETCSATLLNWLLSAYSSRDNAGKIRVFSIKVALATMCAGKLMDKLRYIFSLVSDGNGHMIAKKLAEYLREVLALPAAVYESPSFSFNDALPLTIFTGTGPVTVNDFLDTMMSEPGPPCLIWIPLLHRLASVENVIHPVACSTCGRGWLEGLRYRCTRCSSYTQCQDCFWLGRLTPPHALHHQMKEYTSYKSTSKQIGDSLRKSFRCVPHTRPHLPRYPDTPERTLNLSHIVPASPLPVHNGIEYGGAGHTGSLDSRTSRPRQNRGLVEHLASMGIDDEHKLIARYAARLAHQTQTMPRTGRSASLTPDATGGRGESGAAARAQRDLIAQLEHKNLEIMQEIARLRQQQENEPDGSSGGGSGGSALVSELRALRQRKDELEQHLSALQDSRRHLMQQLEGLMRTLKTQQGSPRSTPNSSPRSGKSPPIPAAQANTLPTRSARSAPQTPSLGERERLQRLDLAIHGVGVNGDRSVRNDLMYAADSLSSAMTSLVRELNSESSDAEETEKSNYLRRRPHEGEEAEDEDSDEANGGRYATMHEGPPPLPARKAFYNHTKLVN